MASKEQKHQESRPASIQREPKPAAETQPQANPAALVQRAALAAPSLSANNVHQLQRAVGNQAVGGVVGQASNQKKGVAQRLGADVTRVPNGVIVDPQEKEIFLEQLHAAVCETASDVLGPTWSASSCPQIQKTFKHYALLSPGKVERIMQRFSGVSAVSKASDYIAPVCARIRGTIRRWGLDEEDMSWEMGASDLPIALESNHSARGKRAKAQLKRKAGAGAATGSVVTPDDLGHGRPIDGGTAARMGQAFGGENFGDVRIHTEAAAAQKTRGLNADAMAMGSHVAFAPGEYQPGSPSGDSLIAHELAHVIQQRGSEPFTQRRAAGVQPAGTPQEHDADQAAAAVVARLHAPAAGGEASASAGGPIRPALASGLGVQRGDKPEKKDVLEQTEKKQEVYEGPSEEEKARAISKAYDDLIIVAAKVAKEKEKDNRFQYWSLDQIIKSGGINAWIAPALDTEEGQSIVSGLYYSRYASSREAVREAILAEPKKRADAEELKRAADRRLVPRQAIGDNDLSLDKQNKKTINDFCDSVLLEYKIPIETYDEQKVAAVVKIARALLLSKYGYQLSDQKGGALSAFDTLVKLAQQKGYPVEDQDFVNSLIPVAIALHFIGTSGSVNADREDSGGDKAKSRR